MLEKNKYTHILEKFSQVPPRPLLLDFFVILLFLDLKKRQLRH